MKSKELIKQLQKLDPEGETEVLIGNHDIHFADRMPCWYDGRGQKLIRDESKEYCNIVGAKYLQNEDKIKLYELSIEDAIYDNPELAVDLSDLKDQESYKKMIEDFRARSRLCIKECEERMRDIEK